MLTNEIGNHACIVEISEAMTNLDMLLLTQVLVLTVTVCMFACYRYTYSAFICPVLKCFLTTNRKPQNWRECPSLLGIMGIEVMW